MGVLRNIFNSVVGQLPVIGPTDNHLEAELMLAGKKPLSWIVVPDPHADLSGYQPWARADYERRMEYIRRLDQAVAEGRLKSVDVIADRGRRDPYDLNSEIIETPPMIFRHYCQPGNEDMMLRMAAYNQKMFNFEEPGFELDHDEGVELGYRKRDIWYWGHKGDIFRSQFMFDLATKVNMKIAQPAYRAKELHKIEKEQKKAEKWARKWKSKDPQPPRA